MSGDGRRRPLRAGAVINQAPADLDAALDLIARIVVRVRKRRLAERGGRPGPTSEAGRQEAS